MSKLLEQIQEHEREWGTENYKDRPTLAEMLSAPVVAFWIEDRKEGDRVTITLHTDLKEIREYYETIFRRMGLGFPNRRLQSLFAKGKELRVKLQFDFEVVS